MKGIVLPDGYGTWNDPITRKVPKQDYAVCCMPIVYYSLSALILAERAAPL